MTRLRWFLGMDDPEELRNVAIDHGIDPEQHCCLQMAARIGLAREVPGWVPVVYWAESWNEYLVGAANNHNPDPEDNWDRSPMSFCPWCGSELPRSRREDWHKALYGLGYADPGNDEIPPEYDSDAWWRAET